MLIKNIKLSKKKILFIVICLLAITALSTLAVILKYNFNFEANNVVDESFLNIENTETQNTVLNEEINNSSKDEDKSYIKWFEFNVSYNVLLKTLNLDVSSHNNNENVKYNWIELISYLACKYGNDFTKFKQADLDKLIARLKSGETIATITKDMKNYAYYYEGYEAVLSQFIGEYNIQKPNSNNAYEKVYGLKAFHPLAQNYSYSHYDDFGNSRSYGYKRLHFGNDLMGSIGTPVIAVESGYIEAVGWNQYGGWRIGIRSFDKKRYYYYAHLRKGHPYAEDIYEGKIVQAGDVIGYLGMTGYSTKEDVNNINVPHLHFGIQLIFNEVQKDGSNQVWVDVYNIVDLLRKNRSSVIVNNTQTKDYIRKYEIMDPIVPE